MRRDRYLEEINIKYDRESFREEASGISVLQQNSNDLEIMEANFLRD